MERVNDKKMQLNVFFYRWFTKKLRFNAMSYYTRSGMNSGNVNSVQTSLLHLPCISDNLKVNFQIIK